MFTLSIRPSASTKPTNLCMNFEQESLSWKPSTFSDAPAPGNDFGLYFYSPLENVEITLMQLAEIIVGLEGAYDTLANNIFEQADAIMSKTPFGSKDMFMQCIPRGIFETPPDISDISSASDSKAAVPIMLINPDAGKSIFFDGRRWVLDDIPADFDANAFVGDCFGCHTYYRGAVNGVVSITGKALAEMLDGLLHNLTYLNTDAKVFVKNLESAQ